MAFAPRLFLIIAAAACAGGAIAQSDAVIPRSGLPAYLAPERRPDTTALITPPPAPDSEAGRADTAIFRATRALEGTPRWSLATSDDDAPARGMLGKFACALGIAPTSAEAPATTRLLGRVFTDAGSVIGPPKDFYQRPRPFVVNAGPVCIKPSEAFARSGAYPSGHTIGGWTDALILAELAPDKSTAILARGRAFGESRVVCGVHWASDVESGRTAASALVAALHAEPAFRADMEAARVELAALRAAPHAAPPADRCAVEAEASAKRPW